MLAGVDRRPYWRYRHSHASVDPRDQHLAWDGLVLRHDNPWWDTHYPPNGWGCKCFVEALTEEELRALGKDGPDQAPATVTRKVTVGARGPNPTDVDVPEGIDPGWGYPPGRTVAQQRMERGFRRDLGDGYQEDLAAVGPMSAGLATKALPGPAELVAVHRYTRDGERSKRLNRELIRSVADGRLPPEDVQHFAFTLGAALDKLPDYRGTVLRRVTLTPGQRAKYAPGQVVTEHMFTSTSKSRPYEGDTFFVIRSRSGKDVSMLSARPHEEEVLFRYGTRFRVVDVEQTRDDVYTVYLAELPES